MPVNGIQYNQCTGIGGTQLQRFFFQTQYPFVYSTLSAPNFPTCTAVVCDLVLGIATVTKPSSLTATDGSISITGTSSRSPIKYSLTNIPYTQMDNTSGSFTGLGLGNYTIYAADPYSCRATCPISITDPIVPTVTYGAKYRQEYKDYYGRSTRIDILEKSYSGAVSDAVSGSEPIELRLRNENGDFFDPILAGELTQNLTSQTNFQYLSLYTADERKYQVIYYKDLGSGLTEQWRGFINPILYHEKYDRDTNYSISVVSTDQLATLKDIDFLYDSGAKVIGTFSLIQLVAICLLKTDLGLPIRTAINIYESNQASTSSDDPLAQTYIDAATYDGMSCADVLENILGAFGATVRQWAGYWWIRRRAEETASINYREYSAFGVYSSSGSHTITSTAWKWRNRSQSMEVLGSKAKVEINQKLTINPYYFTNGGFENDIISGFTLVNNGNSAIFYIISPGNQSGHGIMIQSNGVNSTYGSDAYIQLADKNVLLDGSETIKFSFDFFPDNDPGTLNMPFVKFRVSLAVGGTYLQADGTWGASQWIDFVAQGSQFNSWNTAEITAKAPAGITTGTATARVMVGTGTKVGTQGQTWYYSSIGNLQAVATVGLPINYVAQVYTETVDVTLTTYTTRNAFYKLRAGTDATSSPLILRPADYNAATNAVVWENITGHASGYVYGSVDYSGVFPPFPQRGYTGYVRIFDNVSLQILPKGNQPPDSKTYTFYSSSKNKKTYSKDFENGDSPIDVVNGKNSYINVFKLSNGNATGVWKRKTTTEYLQLLALLSKQIAEQTYTPKFKLTGDLMCTTGGATFLGFNTCFNETSTGKYYSVMAMTIKDKLMAYDVELHQIVPETANGVISEFNTSEFSLTEVGTSIRFNS